ncbi:hypothetical protein PoB_003170100 [Plakobranchus ocellatus]|uniref:Uncharacterized protein n=1 Tax=Plakobranchus ocellatus TaxID=259542 RepID=A0AAV4AA45_9GAST|nr:hypothetical protein PoB_003170100 [Plakobranchus ocellatus]
MEPFNTHSYFQNYSEYRRKWQYQRHSPRGSVGADSSREGAPGCAGGRGGGGSSTDDGGGRREPPQPVNQRVLGKPRDGRTRRTGLHTEQLARWAEIASAAAAAGHGGLGGAPALRHRRRSHGGNSVAISRPRAHSHLSAQHGHRRRSITLQVPVLSGQGSRRHSVTLPVGHILGSSANQEGGSTSRGHLDINIEIVGLREAGSAAVLKEEKENAQETGLEEQMKKGNDLESLSDKCVSPCENGGEALHTGIFNGWNGNGSQNHNV